MNDKSLYLKINNEILDTSGDRIESGKLESIFGVGIILRDWVFSKLWGVGQPVEPECLS
jgi:hypothetical protein